MSVLPTECLVSKDYHHDDDSSSSRSKAQLGYASIDIARNYVGSDTASGNEIVAASQLGGKVAVWVRLDPVLADKGATIAEDVNVNVDANSNDSNSNNDGTKYYHHVKPQTEFTIPTATGTTLAIRPPTLGNYYSKKESDVLVAVGCANGAVILCKTGILAARPGNTTSASSIVGDTSSSTTAKNNETIHILSNSTPGEIVATIGGGHACVMSLTFHPTIPNTFAVGRRDGTIDIYSSTSTIDHTHGYYQDDTTSTALTFRRMHRLAHSSFPIRALGYSQPDGALLFAGDDDGKLYSYDSSVSSSAFDVSLSSSSAVAASSASLSQQQQHQQQQQSQSQSIMTAPVKLVACALTAHKGWIMNLTPLPDGKRVATCGSDGSVKVWDCGMGLASSTPVHSFDSVHSGWIWGVGCGSVVGGGGSSTIGGIAGAAGGRLNGNERLKLISCGNDGVMQVFSCGE